MSACPFPPKGPCSTRARAVCILLKVVRISRDFNGVYLQGHKLKLWKVLEATVQSTAIYSAAAVSLVITFVNSTAVGYPTCLDVFPALIVRTARTLPRS